MPLSYHEYRDRERTGEYTFRSDSFTLYSRSELDELAAILKGRLYKGILPDSLVLWGYRMDIKEISREQWNGMGQHGQIRMKFMGYGPVRIHSDNENHTVTVYRINDSL